MKRRLPKECVLSCEGGVSLRLYRFKKHTLFGKELVVFSFGKDAGGIEALVNMTTYTANRFFEALQQQRFFTFVVDTPTITVNFTHATFHIGEGQSFNVSREHLTDALQKLMEYKT